MKLNRFQTATMKAASRLCPNGSADTIKVEIGRDTGKMPSLVKTIGVLADLEQRGCLSYTMSEADPAMILSRRLYAPTQAGSRALLAALSRPTLRERVLGLFSRRVPLGI